MIARPFQAVLCAAAVGGGPDEYRAALDAEARWLAKVVEAAGLKAQ